VVLPRTRAGGPCYTLAVKYVDLASPKTFLPGVKAKHAVISSVCRKAHGDEGAVDEALARLRAELLTCMKGWPLEKAATFHVVATVDRAGRSG